MSRKDTKSIKYVLNEMDPSEEIEFEREMQQDPDLIIEVESIKRIKRRLDQLPKFSPPQDLSESLLTFAAKESLKEGVRNRRYFLSAAILLFGLTTGSLFLDNPFESDASHSQASTSINLNSPSMGGMEYNITNRNNLSPWVDRDNVIRLSGFESGNFNSRILELDHNQTRLRPADNSYYPTSIPRSLHLTGSNR